MKRLLPLVFCLGIFSLFFFSFTQVDLSLTLSRVSAWQGIQKFFQHIGYFDRPVSTYWYLLTLFVLFVSYIGILIKVKKNEIKSSTVWKIIIFSSLLLAVSYNAFSYDIFNYVFYAKIVTFYHQNPYIYKALDFPNDPMLSFMHWTHSTYPYGPFWLAVSIPLSFLGLNIFLLTFFLFKFLAVSAFLFCCFLIEKISKKIKLENSTFNLVFFALNPLVVIESLVSAHNDILMMALSLAGIYFMLGNSKAKSLFFLSMSFLIKWVTGVLVIPFVLFILGSKNFKKAENLIGVSLLFLSIGLIYALTKYEMQPWYFLWILPFAAIYKKTKLVLSLTIGLSIGLLLTYVPFFYTGNWDPPIPTIKALLVVLSGIISVVIFQSFLFIKRRISINV